MVGVGIVGYGVGRFHAGLISQVKGLELRAVCDRIPGRREAAEQDHGVKTYARMSSLLKDDEIDLVVIATAHNTHARLCVQALGAKKHVVVEKPMCLDTAQADQMIRTAKRNRRLLSVFKNRRWDSDYLTVKKVIEEGLIGKPFLIESRVGSCGELGGWRREKRYGGGMLYDWGAHLIDQMLHLVASPVDRVYATVETRISQMTADNFSRVALTFLDGTQGFVQVTTAAHLSLPRWYVLAQKGALIRETFEDDPPTRLVTQVGSFTSQATIKTIKGDPVNYYRNISAVLNRGAKLIVQPADVRRAIAVIEAAFRSAKSGQAVRLPARATAPIGK